MKLFFAQVLVFLSLTFTAGATAIGDISLFDHIKKDAMVEVSLSVDLDQIIEMKRTETVIPAVFGYGTEHWDVKVNVRGKYRRTVCDFPPLKLKFSKESLRAEGMGTHNDFKLVTHCSDDWNSREYVAREQLAYELYNLVSEKSLRTQLVKISYEDTQSNRTLTRYGILIEDIDEMAERMGATELDDQYNLPAATFRDGSLERVAMFEYMIGNADYDAVMLRNIKIIQTPDGANTAVPYDFDFAGLVAAPYARPDVALGQTKITDRVMRYDFTAENYLVMAQEFQAKQTAILALVADYPYLSKRTRTELTDYLYLFFNEIETSLHTGQMIR